MQYELTSSALVAPPSAKNILVCDTHPVAVAGVESFLGGHQELRFADSASSLLEALDVLNDNKIDVVLIEKAFGWRAIEEFFAILRQGEITPAIVIWGSTMSEAEKMHFIHAGARGVLVKTKDASSFIACLRAVASGRLWTDYCSLRTSTADNPRTVLTAREREVYELVERGFKNGAIAQELQIRPGTVKIHMKHIFAKTGIRGRHSLALASISEVDGGESEMHSAVA